VRPRRHGALLCGPSTSPLDGMFCRSTLLLLAALLATSVAVASALRLGSFRIDSAGIGDSGPIVVSGTQGRGGIESLAVQAFGKQISLSAAQLSRLHSTVFDDVVLSYESRRKQFGGRTIWVTFSRGFSSQAANRQLVETAVEITESGTVRVRALVPFVALTLALPSNNRWRGP
jgi:hypothetical protein